MKHMQNPSICRIPVLLAGALAFLASGAGLWISTLGTGQVLWISTGFTLLAILAAGFAIAVGLGKFAPGFGMASLCIGGTILVASGFAMIDLRPNLGGTPSLARFVLPWMGVQAALSMIIVAAGGAAVLMRKPATWRTLILGVLFLAAAAGTLIGGMFAWRLIPEDEAGRVIALGLLLVGGLVIGILLSVGGHLVIRAFEQTAEDHGTSGPA
jgi:hypothetical protein